MKRTLLIVIMLCVASGILGTYLRMTSLLQGQAPPTVGVPKELASYRDVVKKVLPAVVSIEALNKNGGKVPRRRDSDMQLPDGLRGDQDPDRVGFGSGFVMSPKGVVVTNHHVVDGADTAVVRFKDSRSFTSTRISRDPKTDLAIIVLDTKAEFPYLEFGNSDTMEIGDRVLAVGAPFGLTGTVTQGIISSVGRSLRMNMYEDFLQTDAAINPGNSGGPLVNLEGKVIGVNSAIKSKTGGFQGIGLAISSNLARTVADALLKDGTVKRGYLGVGIRDVDDVRAKALGLDAAGGVEVTYLYADAPGDKAGLQKGDVIRRLGGKPIRDGRELQIVVAGLPLGKPADVAVWRDGKAMELKVTIEEQPTTFGASRSGTMPDPDNGALTIEKCGLAVNDLIPEWAERLGYEESARGALIVRMTRSGLAAVSGLQAGMLIVAVDGKRVNSAKVAATALAAGSVRAGIEVEARTARGVVRTFTLRDD
ncbi:MAG: PDZ domain-containing protein [Planctomycetia bacterium]|nr:PDZ domain-containing protein [Planctomycetia bacterium]